MEAQPDGKSSGDRALARTVWPENHVEVRTHESCDGPVRHEVDYL
jgi:hypothetical protein